MQTHKCFQWFDGTYSNLIGFMPAKHVRSPIPFVPTNVTSLEKSVYFRHANTHFISSNHFLFSTLPKHCRKSLFYIINKVSLCSLFLPQLQINCESICKSQGQLNGAFLCMSEACLQNQNVRIQYPNQSNYTHRSVANSIFDSKWMGSHYSAEKTIAMSASEWCKWSRGNSVIQNTLRIDADACHHYHKQTHTHTPEK